MVGKAIHNDYSLQGWILYCKLGNLMKVTVITNLKNGDCAQSVNKFQAEVWCLRSTWHRPMEGYLIFNYYTCVCKKQCCMCCTLVYISWIGQDIPADIIKRRVASHWTHCHWLPKGNL